MRTKRNLALRSRRLALFFAVLFFASSASAQPAADRLVVQDASGAVKLQQHEQWQTPTRGMVVSLPAVISTGSDGALKLRQNKTVISIAANTAIELLEGPVAGQPLQRVIQNKGSAFYDVETRKDNKLRVETPYLVAVIKGTQFDVTVAAETSTVALYEGQLLIEAPDVGDSVDLHEGQIAKRHKDDPGITVLGMNDGEPVARGARPESRGGSAGDGDRKDRTGELAPDLRGNDNGGIAAGSDGAFVDRPPALDFVDELDALPDGTEGSLESGDAGMGAGLNADLDLGDDDVGLDADLKLDALGALAGLDADFEAGDGDIGFGLDADVDLGDAGVDLGLDAGMELGDGDLALDLEAGFDLGDASVDAGLDADLDLGGGDIDLDLEADFDLGDASVDAGLDTDVDLGGGDIDLDLDADLDFGDASVDAGLDAGVDLDGGDVDLDLGIEADLGDTTVDAGLETEIDLDEGDVDLDVDLPVADVGVGIDLDDGLDDLLDVELDLDLLDDSEEDSDSDDDSDDGLLPDLGDLLGL